MKKYSNLNAQWIVGYVDGGSCFSIGISKNKEMSIGYQVLPEFVVTRDLIDIETLYSLKAFFKCGVVRKSKGKNDGQQYCYRVRGQKHLLLHIIPFFEKHELRTLRKTNFINFRRVLLLMKEGEHLTEKGLERIRQLRKKIKIKGS